MLATLTENHSYGNLYFKDDAFPGCENAEVIGEVPDSIKKVVEDRFVIGPVVDQGFWHRERASMSINRGPCEIYYIRPRIKHVLMSNYRETSSGLSKSNRTKRDRLDRKSCYSKTFGWSICNVQSAADSRSPHRPL
jgi:hypothetical protein